MKLFCHWRRLRDVAGSEIAEAALILPLLFTLLLGIYWFGRAFSIYGTINHAARMAALTAAAPACANCAGGASGGFPADDVVADVISNALTAANLDPTQVQPLTPSPLPQPCPDPNVASQLCTTASSGNFTICRNVVLNQNSSPTQQTCGMIVSFQYPYQFVLPFTSLNKQLVLLKAYAATGGEN